VTPGPADVFAFDSEVFSPPTEEAMLVTDSEGL
jgi:hypothetical protein